MAKILGSLKPQPLWDIFESICKVPHPSKHEEKLIKFILEFAKEHQIEAFQEKSGNVIMRKPAAPGMEKLKGVILQSHLDMVPQKNSDSSHDFYKDPIVPRIEGRFVKATGTTLGADNGIGIAASLALMASKNINHGPLECLMTFDEESGLTGALKLESGSLKGKILLNLDSEAHGELFIGCAGGQNTTGRIRYKVESAGSNMKAFHLAVKGLKGGHSGVDIHLGRGNAIKLITRVLWNAARDFGIRITELKGGTLRNAIPREAFALVAVPAEMQKGFSEFVSRFADTAALELAAVDPGVSITMEPAPMPDNVIVKVSQKKILNALYSCPNGVFRMSSEMEGLVETSNNLAMVKAEKGEFQIATLQRSSVDSQKDDIAFMIASVLDQAGAKYDSSSSYPGWKPDLNSEILDLMKKVFKKMYGTEPGVAAIHAGLECGLFKSVYPHWDMISFGPSIHSPHSPDESVEIESVGKFWDLLIETLKNIPKKS
ncbi:MAG: aminoacyl-histidine dipeptidase [Candidatus Wallbacteria bacterium]|nr:aminoacyl-histidine dipeptidase [Candidatus Wallbacteria bacterium]